MNKSDNMVSIFVLSNGTDHTNQTMDFEMDSPEEAFAKGSLRFTIYSSIRTLEVIFGLVGNILTLVIIKQLRYRSIGHIGMTYLAMSDILTNLTYPVTFYTFALETFADKVAAWATVCIVKEVILYVATVACIMSYLLLSVDRYVKKFSQYFT